MRRSCTHKTVGFFFLTKTICKVDLLLILDAAEQYKQMDLKVDISFKDSKEMVFMELS